jgi:ribonuclease HI
VLEHPPDNVFKINTDEAFNPNTHFGGVGALAQDHHDKFLYKEWTAGCLMCNLHLLLRWKLVVLGLKLLSNEADIKVVVETDSMALVDLWKVRDHDQSEIVMILVDIQELTRSFSSFSLVHVKRGANWAAHL